MCPFGDIKDVPDSCDGKSGFFIVESSCAICPLSKTVLHLPLADSCGATFDNEKTKSNHMCTNVDFPVNKVV